MLNLKVTFDDENFLFTKFNGTIAEAKNYYVGNYFDITSNNIFIKCVRIAIL